MMRRHAELLCEHMGEERGCKEFRKHVSWYLKGFAAGGDAAALAGAGRLARRARRAARRARPDEPFPVRRAGHAPRPPGSPRARVVLPEGWLDDTDGTRLRTARGCDRGHGRMTRGDQAG